MIPNHSPYYLTEKRVQVSNCKRIKTKHNPDRQGMTYLSLYLEYNLYFTMTCMCTKKANTTAHGTPTT